MPTPTTSKWPKPKDDDEFESMAVDFLRIRWKDPNAQRNGRNGQSQNGIDVVGHPSWGNGETAGAQCKNAKSLTLKMVVDEVEKAKTFKGGLSELLIVTSADRDSKLQSNVRQHFKATPPPFDVELVFWSDMTADLSIDDGLVAKHWKGFGGVPPPAPSQNAPAWIDHVGVRDDESTECQCEIALSVPSPGIDLVSGEVAAELERMLKEKVCGLYSGVLVGQRAVQVGGRRRWEFSQRECSNVIRKWALEVGDGGAVAFRWAKFTSVKMCLFEIQSLFDGIVDASQVLRLALQRAAQRLGFPAPTKISVRITAHGSGPLILHDDIRVVGFMLSGRESPAEWTVDFESDFQAMDSKRVAIRLLNRVLAKFSQGREGGPIPTVNEDSAALTSIWGD